MTIDSPKQERFSGGGAIWVVFLPALAVVIVAVVLSLMFSPPEPVAPVVRLVCTEQGEVIFNQPVTSGTQESNGSITITLNGYTSTIAQPEKGECHLVK